MPRKHAPPPPGKIIRQQIVERLKIKQAAFASALGISPSRVTLILKGRAPISAEVALRIARVTSTSPDYWLRLQTTYDLYRAGHGLRGALARLTPLWDGDRHHPVTE